MHHVVRHLPLLDVVQDRHGTDVLDHADCTRLIRRRELDHTDHTDQELSICHAWQI